MAVTLQEQLGDLVSISERIFFSLTYDVDEMFKSNPISWAESKGIWVSISSIIDVTKPVACSIVVLLFLIGFFANSVDVKEELNFEKALRMLIRLGVTEWFILNSVTIAQYLFTFVNGLTGSVGGSARGFVRIPSIAEDIYAMDAASKVIFLFPVILYLIVMPVCGGIIFLMAVTRMIKILLLLPYGPFAYATIAGGIHALNSTLTYYIKYLFGTLFEAFSIMAALNLGRSLLNHGSILTGIETSGYLMSATLKLLDSMLAALFMVWIIKQSQNLATKALGLDRP